MGVAPDVHLNEESVLWRVLLNKSKSDRKGRKGPPSSVCLKNVHLCVTVHKERVNGTI